VRCESAADAVERDQARGDLTDLFLVMQLFSYPADYLAGKPSLERLAETVDKLEEDILHVRTASLRGTRRAILSFGEPVLAEPNAARGSALAITRALEGRVQNLLDDMNGSGRMSQLDPTLSPVAAVEPLEAATPASFAAA
jgi:hypothetical protein